MRLRWLALFPLLYAAVFAAAAVWLIAGVDVDLPAFVAGQRILVRILSAAGCLAAVSVFEPGDRLRRAWLWLGAAAVSILARDVLRLFPPFSAGTDAARVVLTGLAILSNLTLLAGIWMLARSWRMVAIEMPGGRPGVMAIAVVTAALALGVAGPGALHEARAATEDAGSIILLVSALVDIVTLCLITPLLLTAVAMRGGLFSWPWGLVTASQISWLLYDAVAAFGPAPDAMVFPLPDLFRGLAENFLFAAGLAQFYVVRHVRRMARGVGSTAGPL
jgi:hypothetical protein